MKDYTVEIGMTGCHTLTVQANSEKEALSKAIYESNTREKYYRGICIVETAEIKRD